MKIKLIYTVKGAMVFSEKTMFVPQIGSKVLLLNSVYLVKELIYNLDDKEQTCYVEMDLI